MTFDQPSHKSYQPSGKVSWSLFSKEIFVGLLGVLSVAAVSARLQSGTYIPIVGTFLYSLPVYYFIHRAIRKGQCRNRWIGGLAGLLLMTAYCLGQWGWLFLGFVLQHGLEESTRLLSSYAGSNDFFRFIRFFANEAGESDRLGSTFFLIVIGLETAVLHIIGLILGRKLSGFVFYESQARWATRERYYYDYKDNPKLVWQAIKESNWKELVEIPKSPRVEFPHVPHLILYVDHLPGDSQEPVYLTLRAINIADLVAHEDSVIRRLIGEALQEISSNSKLLLKQRQVPAEYTDGMEDCFPELRWLSPEQEAESKRPVIHYSEGLRGWFERRLWGPARIGGKDFRSDAAAESMEILNGRTSISDLPECEHSLCVPVAKGEEVDMRPIIRKIRLTNLGLILSLIIEGMVSGLLALATLFFVTPKSYLSLLICIPFGCGLFLFLAFMTLRLRDFLFLRSFCKTLERRSRTLFSLEDRIDFIYVAIEDAKTYHVRKRVSEDLGILVPDLERGRLLIEGCLYRYIIRKEDVVDFRLDSLWKMRLKKIRWKVGETTVDMSLSTLGSVRKGLIFPAKPFQKVGEILGVLVKVKKEEEHK